MDATPLKPTPTIQEAALSQARRSLSQAATYRSNLRVDKLTQPIYFAFLASVSSPLLVPNRLSFFCPLIFAVLFSV